MSKSIGKNLLSNNFKVFPVKFSETSTAVSYLFYKLHQLREQDIEKPSGRTLFVVNIPPYCTEECLTRIFSECGTVEKITFQRLTGSEYAKEELTFLNYNKNIIHGYKVGYVVFSEAEQCTAALDLTDTTPRILSTKDNPLSVGIKKWCEDYNKSIPDISEMQNEIDKYMGIYDKKVSEKVLREKEMDGVEDDEGWIKVTRHSSRPVTLRNEAQEKKAVLKEKIKRQQMERVNLYNFQFREKQINRIAELRQRFEEDKQKVAIMKASRKFRPY